MSIITNLMLTTSAAIGSVINELDAYLIGHDHPPWTKVSDYDQRGYALESNVYLVACNYMTSGELNDLLAILRAAPVTWPIQLFMQKQEENNWRQIYPTEVKLVATDADDTRDPRVRTN